MYALFPGVITVYLWLACCASQAGGKATLMCFLLTGWKERGPPRSQSTSVLLKLASLLIYLCLNRTKEPNTVALRTFLASTEKRWHASLFWRESWIKYEFLRAKKGYIYVQWGWFMEKFWSYNVHIDFFLFFFLGKCDPDKCYHYIPPRRAGKYSKCYSAKDHYRRYMLNIESEKRRDICLKYWLWNRHTNRMDVCVMLLLRQFAVMAYEPNRVTLRGL